MSISSSNNSFDADAVLFPDDRDDTGDDVEDIRDDYEEKIVPVPVVDVNGPVLGVEDGGGVAITAVPHVPEEQWEPPTWPPMVDPYNRALLEVPLMQDQIDGAE
jgi:hypothetical protein